MRWRNLANALKDRYRVLEVSYVEYRNDKLNVCVMADTIDGTKATGLTERGFVGSSLNRR